MIYEVDFQKTVEDAFLLYGASVAQERSIPDVRDGLKEGLRQGLYAQFSNNLTYKDKFQKAQKSVAAAMAQSYTHGDAAIYDTLIRAAKPWVYRYPIIAVQGAYGDPCAPDNHSASRYVEMKSGPIADYMYEGLKKGAISEWYDNYDDTEKIPSVLPSIGFWNIVNGCDGIAVGLATSVPEFNLKEVNNALIKIIRNPKVSFDEIYCAPDFAQGGTILNGLEVKNSLLNGTGSAIKLRANLKYDIASNMIQATEMPYGVFTNTIISQLKTLTDKDENYGIEKVVDHTKKNADIRIYLKAGINPRKMMAKLYKNTSLESSYSVNMIMLDHGRFPKIWGWREACDAYIAHMRECQTNIIKYELEGCKTRLNIVNGLLSASANINNIVNTIRASISAENAQSQLEILYKFNPEQAKAILAMKLSALSKMDSDKLKNEQTDLKAKIARYDYILSTPAALDEEVIKKLEEVSEKFGDDRRTKIIDCVENADSSDTEDKPVGLILFDNNMMRAVAIDELQPGSRGRKGVNIKPPRGATIKSTIYTATSSAIAIFTDAGKMYSFSLMDMNIGTDYSIYEFIELQDSHEKVVEIVDASTMEEQKWTIFITKNGLIKKTDTAEYSTRARKGFIALKLEGNDTLQNVFFSNSNEDKIMVVSNSGHYNYYNQSEILTTGRSAKGRCAMRLGANEYITDATLVKSGASYQGILSVSKNGNGKITALDDFPMTSIAVKGNIVMKLEENDEVSAISAIPNDVDKLILVNGKVVTISLKMVPIQGRATKGASLINNRDKKEPLKIITA